LADWKDEDRVAGIIRSLDERGLLKGRGKKRVFGRLGGHKGAEYGIEGFHRGYEGGAPPKSSVTEAAEVWRLHRETDLSPYRISELVFGDRRYHMRVRRLIGIS
jgi:hypothetical protein